MSDTKEKLKTICAWCGNLIQDGKTIEILGKPRISHGMCKKCYNNIDEIQNKMMAGEKFPYDNNKKYD